MDLMHCAYTSTGTRPIGPEELESILAVSRANNQAAGVTGMLLHADGRFFQVLEGPEPAVEGVYARIAADPRHRELRRVLVEPIARRGRPPLTRQPAGP